MQVGVAQSAADAVVLCSSVRCSADGRFITVQARSDHRSIYDRLHPLRCIRPSFFHVHIINVRVVSVCVCEGGSAASEIGSAPCAISLPQTKRDYSFRPSSSDLKIGPKTQGMQCAEEKPKEASNCY